MSGEGPRTRDKDGRAKVDAGEQPGGRIGRYVVVSRLGEGAMGMVYLAYDPQLDRRVALKVLRRRIRSSRSAEERQQRLRREAQAMAQLNHANVVTVHDVGVAEGRVFLAMDYVVGQDLRAWLDEGPHPWNTVLRTLINAGRGLTAAHEAGVIHRDFKPENVLVGEDGTVKVMDFGLARPQSGASRSSGVVDTDAVAAVGEGERAPTAAAKTVAAESEAHSEAETQAEAEDGSVDWWRHESAIVDVEGGVHLTRSGDVLGTPTYMAPELFEGAEANAQTDQFSFCVALYEGLYGVRPFAGESMAALAFNMNRERFTSPPRGTRVPVWLGRLVRRGLALDPSRRYPSMEALLHALIQGAARRRIRRAGLTGLGLILLGGGLSYALVPATVPCQGGEDRVATVWNDDRGSAIASAFEATGVPYAAEALSRAEQRLETYAEAWVETYTEVCEATAVHKQQTPEQLDRRIACLDERLAELDALLEVLGEADQRVAERAAQAASDLRDPKTCAAESLAERPESADPEKQRQVEVLRTRLRRAEALENAGRYDDAVILAGEIAAEAELLGEVLLHGEALVQMGQAEDMAGQYAAATEHLRQAYFVTNEAGFDLVAAQSAVALISVEGVHLAHADEGLSWARHAEAAFERSDPQSVLRGRYHAALGSLHLQRYELDDARLHYEKAIAIEREAFGEDHEQVATLLAYLGIVQEQSGRSEDAVASFEKAIDITQRALGSDHPALATLHNNYATLLFGRQDLVAARAQLERAVAIQRQALGAHPSTAMFIDNLGGLLYLQGERERGKALIEEALAMREAILGPEHVSVAQSLTNLADVMALQDNPGGARRSLERALAILEKTMGPHNPQTTRAVTNLARIDLEEGMTQRAHDRCEKALAVVDEIVGDEHVELVSPLLCLSWAKLELGEPEAALPLLERIDGMRDLAQAGDPALARLLMAHAVLLIEGNTERAAKLRAEARELFAVEGREPPPERVARWMQEPDPAPSGE